MVWVSEGWFNVGWLFVGWISGLAWFCNLPLALVSGNCRFASPLCRLSVGWFDNCRRQTNHLKY